MNTLEIRKLLDKYYDGKSTDEEEKMLLEQFLSGDYSPEFAADAAIFEYFARVAKRGIYYRAYKDHKEKIMKNFQSLTDNQSFS